MAKKSKKNETEEIIISQDIPTDRDIVPKIEIRKTIKNNLFSYDAAFISKTYRKYGIKIGNDQNNLSCKEHLESVILCDTTRVILVDGAYLGFTYLHDFVEDNSGTIITASINGMFNTFINPVDNSINSTSKYYKLAKKLNIFEIVLKHYFEEYNLETIEAQVPEYLDGTVVKTTQVKGRKDNHIQIERKQRLGDRFSVRRPSILSNMLANAGFIRIDKPRRNRITKNGKRYAIFYYQLQKNWFLNIKCVLNNTLKG